MRFRGADVVKASDRLADDNDAGAEGDDASPSQAASEAPGVQLAGDDRLGGVMLVDQSPLGKTPRSNPVVYIGAFDGLPGRSGPGLAPLEIVAGVRQ